MDQTEHILDLVSKYFDNTSSVRQTDTTLQTDKQYNSEIQSDTPASPSEITALVKQYKCSYLSIY